MIYHMIEQLALYGLETGLIQPEDKIYAVNQILDVLRLDDYEVGKTSAGTFSLEEILKTILDYVCEKGLIEDTIIHRDLFDTRLMNCLMPRPGEVSGTFRKLYETEGPGAATDYYYKLSQDSDYIRRYRIAKDVKWTTATRYGELDITINLSKPEKDPKAIAAARTEKQSGYPKCLLCMENEGYAGRLDYPARNNHRIIPLTIGGCRWGFQYSPYVYYNEHCIVFNGAHTPMKVERATFEKLFDFVGQFPHYFLGSNADLPIVGGSILSHDHFQGGNYTFAMARAAMEQLYTKDGQADVEVGIVHWPMSVVRLRGKDAKRVIQLADELLDAWRGYTDETAFIYAWSDGEPHNTITPIARMTDGVCELDLVLRNNITTDEFPMGVYHPHQELHHIKKENIGLIEVMGLAVLPSRLKEELTLLGEYIDAGKDIRSNDKLEKHADWTDALLLKYGQLETGQIHKILEQEVGQVFARVLEDAGVYKCNEEGRKAFERFLNSAGFTRIS